MSGRAIEDEIGVTRPPQSDESPGVRNAAGMMGQPSDLRVARSIASYVSTSGPSISITWPSVSGGPSASMR